MTLKLNLEELTDEQKEYFEGFDFELQVKEVEAEEEVVEDEESLIGLTEEERSELELLKEE